MMTLRDSLTLYRGQVIALWPVYDALAGNACQIYLRNGEVKLHPRSLNLVLRDYLRLWALDRQALQRLYAPDDKDRLLAPLAVTADHTLLPLKARKPIGVHDGAYAYLEAESIDPKRLQEDAEGVLCSIGAFEFSLHCSLRQMRLMLGRGAACAERYRTLNVAAQAGVSSKMYLQQWTVLQGIVNQSMAQMIAEG